MHFNWTLNCNHGYLQIRSVVYWNCMRLSNTQISECGIIKNRKDATEQPLQIDQFSPGLSVDRSPYRIRKLSPRLRLRWALFEMPVVCVVPEGRNRGNLTEFYGLRLGSILLIRQNYPRLPYFTFKGLCSLLRMVSSSEFAIKMTKRKLTFQSP